MYDRLFLILLSICVTGPCEFLVMYDFIIFNKFNHRVTGPCEFLVMYDFHSSSDSWSLLQDPVNF